MCRLLLISIDSKTTIVKKTRLLSLSILISISALGQKSFQSVQSLIDKGDIIAAEQELLKLKEDNSAEYHLIKGDILLNKGDSKSALEQYELAKNQLEQNKENSDQLAKCYSQLGVANWNMRNHNEALKFHNQALHIHESNQSKKGIAASYNDIGLTYSNIEPEKALEYYKKSLPLYKEIYGANDERVATAHINLGIINGKMNFQQDAFDAFDKASIVLKKKYGGDHPRLAFIYSNMGKLHYELKEFEESRQYKEMALAIYKKNYGNEHPEIADTYNSLGDIYLQQGHYLASLQQYQAAICANIPDYNNKSIYSKTPINDYYNPDVLVISIQSKAQALEALHYEKTLKKKDLQAAWDNFNTCDALIDDIRRLKSNENDKIALGEIASEIYEDGIRTSIGLADVSWKKDIYEQKAFYFAEKSKSSVLLDAIADANAKSYASIPDAVIAEESELKSNIAYYRQLVAKNKKQTDRNELFKLESNYQNFVKSLEKNYPEYFNLKYNVSIPTIADIQNLLSDNQAVISYFIAKKQLFTFYLSKKKLKIRTTPMAENFDRYLSGYRNSIYYNVKDTYIKTAVDLHEQLIPTIEKNITSLTIIPAGRLGVIPFEALLTNKSDESNNAYEILPYLVTKYDINTVYAAALMKKSDVESSGETTACIMAPVSFSNHSLPELPGSAQEAMNLNNLFNQNSITSTSYTYSDASEFNIKSEQISSSKYLHFATHGVVDETHPELSQIYLSSSSESEDGNLYTGEIYNLKINADLVTLSACQTGLGKIYKGEGIVGLSRALLYAGANNMVVSLWSVADRSTAELMVDFYGNVLQQNTYSQGLQKAKRKMIEQKTYAAPYYWAPFILIGQ